MIELSQHIETLLLENDCVIVPELGGFVAHYTSAIRIEEENLFLPPTRVIGFNPQLKMNDGVLVQSYMAVYNTSFADATRMIERKVERIFATLHEEGKADLPNIGELRYSIYGTYEFIPYNNKITSPNLYGLDCFEMKALSALTQQATGGKTIPLVPSIEDSKKRNFEIKINRSYLSNAVAMIAVIVLFFLLSTPLENTEVAEGNYAQLLPEELFEKIEKQSLAFTPIVAPRMAEKKKNPLVPIVSAKPKDAHPVIATIPKVADPEVAKPVSPTLPYHIIVASVGTEKDARLMADRLIQKGFSGAKAIIGDGKKRVSIQSCSTEAEVYQVLNDIRKNEAYQNAWVLKK